MSNYTHHLIRIDGRKTNCNLRKGRIVSHLLRENDSVLELRFIWLGGARGERTFPLYKIIPNRFAIHKKHPKPHLNCISCPGIGSPCWRRWTTISRSRIAPSTVGFRRWPRRVFKGPFCSGHGTEKWWPHLYWWSDWCALFLRSRNWNGNCICVH